MLHPTFPEARGVFRAEARGTEAPTGCSCGAAGVGCGPPGVAWGGAGVAGGTPEGCWGAAGSPGLSCCLSCST